MHTAKFIFIIISHCEIALDWIYIYAYARDTKNYTSAQYKNQNVAVMSSWSSTEKV